MTDTTDIAALREGLIELLDHVDSYGGKCWLFPEDVRLIISLLEKLDVAEKKNALVAGGIEAALKMQEQIEAERQRAERGEAAAGIIQESLIKEREHSANFEREANLYHEKCETAEAEIAALKAKLANPVVLP